MPPPENAPPATSSSSMAPLAFITPASPSGVFGAGSPRPTDSQNSRTSSTSNGWGGLITWATQPKFDETLSHLTVASLQRLTSEWPTPDERTALECGSLLPHSKGCQPRVNRCSQLL